jgi:hypothetical protein
MQQNGTACPNMGFHGISWAKLGSQAMLKKSARIDASILFFSVNHV